MMVVLVYKRYNNNYLIHSCIAQGLHLDHAVHYWLICRRHFCFARRGKDTHYPRVYYIVLRVKILHWCHQSSPLSRYSVAMSDQRHHKQAILQGQTHRFFAGCGFVRVLRVISDKAQRNPNLISARIVQLIDWKTISSANISPLFRGGNNQFIVHCSVSCLVSQSLLG